MAISDATVTVAADVCLSYTISPFSPLISPFMHAPQNLKTDRRIESASKFHGGQTDAHAFETFLLLQKKVV